MSNALNTLATSIDAREGVEFAELPPGNYAATITGITQKVVNEKPIWEVALNTERGPGRHTIWGWSPDEIAKVDTDATVREHIRRGIGMIKGMFVELGVWTTEQARAATWNEGDLSVLGSFKDLVGKPCTLAVVKRKTDPNKTNTYINKARQQAQTAPSTPAMPQPAYQGQPTTLDSIPF